MKRRRAIATGAAALVVAAGLAAIPPAGPGRAQTQAPPATLVDIRLLTNPLLAELGRTDPAALARYLAELDAINRAAPQPSRSATTSRPPTPEERRQVDANPDFKAAYAARPDPMLDLLRRINETLRRSTP